MSLLQIITPLNLVEERDKFFQSRTYNPNFNYIWEDNAFSVPKKFNKNKLVQNIINQETELIMQEAKKYFQTDLTEFLEKAKIKTSIVLPEKRKESIEDFIQGFQKAFEFFELAEYKIEVSTETGFNFRPNFRDKKIVMSKNANFGFFSSAGEIRHEIAHIIRYENGVFNSIPKSKKYLPTEEGLATFFQDISEKGEYSEFQHAAEYLASSVGEKGSLREIYNFLVDIGFNEELAWQRASRHKFGFKDTALSGDIIKPAMYFAHSQKISRLSKSEILKLFIGKIRIDEIPSTEYIGRFPLQKLEQFFFN